ncbi:MAG TPA: hypothetical protein VGL77_02495 [Armatimonadota bacterium]|jgi:hypothetical protein
MILDCPQRDLLLHITVVKITADDAKPLLTLVQRSDKTNPDILGTLKTAAFAATLETLKTQQRANVLSDQRYLVTRDAVSREVHGRIDTASWETPYSLLSFTNYRMSDTHISITGIAVLKEQLTPPVTGGPRILPTQAQTFTCATDETLFINVNPARPADTGNVYVFCTPTIRAVDRVK